MLKEKAEKRNKTDGSPSAKGGFAFGAIKNIAKNMTREPTELSVILRLAAGVLLLIVAGLGFMPPVLSVIIRVAAFVVCTYDMIIAAVSALAGKRFFAPEIFISVAGIIALCIGALTDAVLFIIFYRAFHYLLKRFIRWAAKNTEKSLDLRTDEVRLCKDDRITVVPTDSVRVGDLYMVTPGDVIPLDGIVQSGASELDTEPLTGETVTRKVQKDSVVLSGCINASGTLIIKATAVLKDSVVAKRYRYIDRYKVFESKFDKATGRIKTIFVPAVCGAALIVGVIVPIFAGNFPKWLHAAAVLIAAASPLPLFMASPMAYYSQVGKSAKNGVLLKNKETADKLMNVGHVVFDKDGTLSTGRYRIKETESRHLSEDDLLMLASYALVNSNTQIGELIRDSAGKKPNKDKIKNCYEEEGKCCVVQLNDGRVIAAGNAEMLEMMGLPVPETKNGYTPLYVCVGKEYAGAILLQDKVRTDAYEAINGLRAQNVEKISMITMNSEENSEQLARSLTLDGVYHAASDSEKEAVLDKIIDDMGESKKSLVYLSHEFADPALFKKADVGAAMNGLVNDSALENASVVFVKSEPSRLCTAIKAARNIRKTLITGISFVGAATLILALIAVLSSVKLWAFALIQGVAVAAAILIATQGYDFLEKQFSDDQEN